jgi:sortase (surface protein transpeptidase)
MKRTVNILGTVLVACGVALLVVTGALYVHSRTDQPKAAGWTPAQQAKGQQLAAGLKKNQKISIPRSLADAALPKPGTEAPVRLVIPKINVDAPIVQTPPVDGVWQVADWEVGHLTSTPDPGAPGNMAFSAHDDIKG